jgi:predicted chitinase
MYTDLHNSLNPEDQRDFVETPDLIITTPKYAVESAFAWWQNKKMNELCLNTDPQTIKNVTIKVNGGTNGLPHRTTLFNNLWAKIGTNA